MPASAEVRTADEQAAEDKKGIDTFIAFIRGFLLAFGGIALFVGAFVIFNTLSITIAQRVRELATLRTLGASRRQVLRSVLLEAAAIGVVASAVGIAVGIGLAKGLTEVFSALGLELPQSDPVYALRTFVVALVVGVGVTLLAGLAPALRATRVAPIAAVREGAVLPRPEAARRRSSAWSCSPPGSRCWRRRLLDRLDRLTAGTCWRSCSARSLTVLGIAARRVAARRRARRDRRDPVPPPRRRRGPARAARTSSATRRGRRRPRPR